MNPTAIKGDYFLVYPIKVNQHRRVIESLIHSGEPLGLEAGSKAELMAVLAHAGMTVRSLSVTATKTVSTFVWR